MGTKHLVGRKIRTNHSNLKVRKQSRALRRKEQSKALNRGREKAEFCLFFLDLDTECVIMLEHQMAASVHHCLSR